MSSEKLIPFGAGGWRRLFLILLVFFLLLLLFFFFLLVLLSLVLPGIGIICIDIRSENNAAGVILFIPPAVLLLLVKRPFSVKRFFFVLSCNSIEDDPICSGGEAVIAMASFTCARRSGAEVDRPASRDGEFCRSRRIVGLWRSELSRAASNGFIAAREALRSPSGRELRLVDGRGAGAVIEPEITGTSFWIDKT